MPRYLLKADCVIDGAYVRAGTAITLADGVEPTEHMDPLPDLTPTPAPEPDPAPEPEPEPTIEAEGEPVAEPEDETGLQE